MPILTIPLAQGGPIVDFLVAVSKPRAEALRKAQLTVPPAISARCLIDTGASCTALDQRIVQALGLVASGTVQIVTPSTGVAAHVCNQYDVTLGLVLPAAPHVHVLSLTLPVIEADLSKQAIDGLIGRDVLAQCVLGYNGPHGHIFLAV